MAKNARFLESIVEHMEKAERYRPMTTRKLITILTHYRDLLRDSIEPKKLAPYREVPTCKSHLAWMCQNCLTEFIPNGRIEKAMRWLGFVQGVMVCRGMTSLHHIMAHNRTVDEESERATENTQTSQVSSSHSGRSHQSGSQEVSDSKQADGTGLEGSA